jgi:tRNA-2-methylthio-N6-dimethylallyladenosine synthase
MHMPLQSGSSEILKAMKRGYTKEWFLNRAAKLREMVPDVSISTDIIVAFPGESEADFAETMEVMRKVRFEQIFSFKYSPRPLTEAEGFADTVDSEVGSGRLSTLQEFQDTILDEMKTALLGKEVVVYFEELRNDGYVAGRSDNNVMIKVKGSEEWLGKMARVKITEVSRLVQYGEIVA